MRIAAALLVLGAALAGAAVLYSYRTHRVIIVPICVNPRFATAHPKQARHADCSTPVTRTWAEPAAVALVFLGLAGAATVLVATHRRSA
jgi:CRISPR/Cas system-associated protein Csm6